MEKSDLGLYFYERVCRAIDINIVQDQKKKKKRKKKQKRQLLNWKIFHQSLPEWSTEILDRGFWWRFNSCG